MKVASGWLSLRAAKAPGLEVSYRYASFLKRTGRDEEAEDLAASMLKGFDLLPPYAKKNEKRWADAARSLPGDAGGGRRR